MGRILKGVGVIVLQMGERNWDTIFNSGQSSSLSAIRTLVLYKKIRKIKSQKFSMRCYLECCV
jgi:hypothetical protein